MKAAAAALAALVLTSPVFAPGPSVVVTETEVPAPLEIGEAMVGGLYVGAGGELWMVVDPVPVPPDPNFYPYGIREQPERRYVRTTHTVPGYGTFTLQHPGPVYVVDLRDGTLWLVKRTEWVRPVSSWRLVANVPRQ